ncbi:serine hydrolase [bacterium]|nr:serine hydrolase [bacterium]
MRALCKYLALAVAVVLAMSAHTVSAEGMPSDDSIEMILRDRVDLYKKSVGIVVGMVDRRGRKIVAYGKRDLEGDTEVGANTVFEIGSVSKVFTGTLLADAVKRGELRLEDPVSRFLPESVTVPSKDGKEITLLDLATHRSGLPQMPTNFKLADPQNPYADYTVENMYEFLSGYSLTRPVGEAFEYSNLGVGLLGHVLALNAGVDYETLMRTRVCGPLGMESTVIQLTPDLHKRLAGGHTAMRQPTSNWDIPTFAGAGAIRSTTEDMLRFLAASMALVETDLRDVMDEAHSARLPAGGPEMEIGFGWLIHKKHESEIVWHNGGTGGYHSFVGWDRKTGLGVVVLSNSTNDIDDIGRHLMNPAFELAKLELPKERKEITLGAEIYESYVGEYEVVPTFVLTVTHEPEGLSLQATGQSKSRILAEAETEFFSNVVDAQISFGKDESGQVTHLVLHQGGQDVKAMRRGAIVPDEESMQLAPEILDRYVGKYELVPGFVIAITNEGGQLMAQATGQPAIPIYHDSETRFVYRVVDAQIEFQLDDAGLVVGLTLFQGGKEMPAKKME